MGQSAAIVFVSRGRVASNHTGCDDPTRKDDGEQEPVTRNGARLVMNYDATREVFAGVVTNLTSAALREVRVEVHLFNPDHELGPTTPRDLAPGKSMGVALPAVGMAFTTWTAHAEVGPQSGGGEHGPGGEGGGEHG